jgi:hypothetical protein
MSYRLRRKSSVQRSVRKVACEQIDKAIAEIDDAQLDRHKVVHQVRKRCKKLRGLIRLVRPAFSDYSRENRDIRDAARELSYLRDSQSIIDSLDALLAHFQEQLEPDAFASIRQELATRRERIAQDRKGLEQKLERVLTRLRELRQRALHWRIDDRGFAAVSGGLEKTYARGRKALGKAYRSPSPARFHEWRKRTKYHWYHLRLLRRIWPEMLQVEGAAGDKLSDLLGDDHDLAVLRDTLIKTPEQFGDARQLQLLVALIDRRRAELQAQALPLGRRLYAEKPRRMTKRLRQYWSVWKKF